MFIRSLMSTFSVFALLLAVPSFAQERAQDPRRGPSPVPFPKQPEKQPEIKQEKKPTNPAQPLQPAEKKPQPSVNPSVEQSVEKVAEPAVEATVNLELLRDKTIALQEAYSTLLSDNSSPRVILHIFRKLETSGDIRSAVLLHAYKKEVFNGNYRVEDIYNNGKLRAGLLSLAKLQVKYAAELAKNDVGSLDNRLREDWYYFDYSFRNFYSITHHLIVELRQALANARSLSKAELEFYERHSAAIENISFEMFQISANCSKAFGDLRVRPDGSAYSSWYETHKVHRAAHSKRLPLGVYAESDNRLHYIAPRDLVIASPSTNQNSKDSKLSPSPAVQTEIQATEAPVGRQSPPTNVPKTTRNNEIKSLFGNSKNQIDKFRSVDPSTDEKGNKPVPTSPPKPTL